MHTMMDGVRRGRTPAVRDSYGARSANDWRRAARIPHYAPAQRQGVRRGVTIATIDCNTLIHIYSMT